MRPVEGDHGGGRYLLFADATRLLEGNPQVESSAPESPIPAAHLIDGPRQLVHPILPTTD